MPFDFKFPDVGEGITEGKLIAWKVKAGETVKQDQVLAEIETDKAVVEIPAPRSGRISRLNGNPGDTIKVGSVLVSFDDANFAPQMPAAAQADDSGNAAAKAGSVVGFIEEAQGVVSHSGGPEKAAGQKKIPKATLAVRKLAKDLGIDLAQVDGSGAEGMITEEDVKKASGRGPAVKAPIDHDHEKYGPVEAVPMSIVRKTIARRMSESRSAIPDVTHMDEADATRLFSLRESQKKTAEQLGVKLTYLAYIVKAVVEQLKAHPLLNSSLNAEAEEIILKKFYSIGIAMDTPEGLVVPVIRDADKKSAMEIAKSIMDFAELAKNRKISIDDLKGGSFSITNIGSISGLYFTPIINYPEAAILGIGRMLEKPVAVNGSVEIRKMLPLSLSYDHRIIDGAEAARFLKDLTAMIESPETIISPGL